MTLQIIGVLSSWISLAWSFVSFATALRHTLPGKARMRTSGKIGMFVWRFFTIGSRVISLALFGAAFGFFVTLAMIGGHCVVMVIWMLQVHSMYCRIQHRHSDGRVTYTHSPCSEYCFRFLAAFIQIFAFFNLAEGRTRLRALTYYTIIFIENISMVVAWYITASTRTAHDWFQGPALALVLGGFFVGIIFQVLYYKCCHPVYYSKVHGHVEIPWWASMEQLTLLGPEPGDLLEKPQVSEVKGSHETLNSQTGKSPIYLGGNKLRLSSTSLSGVYRGAEDDTLDVNDPESLSYQPTTPQWSDRPSGRGTPMPQQTAPRRHPNTTESTEPGSTKAPETKSPRARFDAGSVNTSLPNRNEELDRPPGRAHGKFDRSPDRSHNITQSPVKNSASLQPHASPPGTDTTTSPSHNVSSSMNVSPNQSPACQPTSPSHGAMSPATSPSHRAMPPATPPSHRAMPPATPPSHRAMPHATPPSHYATRAQTPGAKSDHSVETTV